MNLISSCGSCSNMIFSWNVFSIHTGTVHRTLHCTANIISKRYTSESFSPCLDHHKGDTYTHKEENKEGKKGKERVKKRKEKTNINININIHLYTIIYKTMRIHKHVCQHSYVYRNPHPYESGMRNKRCI